MKWTSLLLIAACHGGSEAPATVSGTAPASDGGPSCADVVKRMTQLGAEHRVFVGGSPGDGERVAAANRRLEPQLTLACEGDHWSLEMRTCTMNAKASDHDTCERFASPNQIDHVARIRNDAPPMPAN
jgi:hypothetical protein